MEKERKTKKQTKQETELRNQLLRNLHAAKYELECATQNFKYATDPMLVDMYTYQIKACQAKYSYLLGCARAVNLTDAGSLLAFSEQ